MKNNNYPTDQHKWTAVCERDAAAVGVFVYSVKTTGIYCLPNCGARTPKREHVSFYQDHHLAEAAGHRACKRCRPHQVDQPHPHTKMIEAACALIDESEEIPNLETLAKRVGLSPQYFHRVFKRLVGVTPKAYAQAKRAGRMQQHLSAGESVTHAMYEAGYSSSSRFYEEAQTRLGMTATQWRKGGAGMRIRYAIVNSSLGLLLIAATEKGICLIHFGDSEATLLALLKERFSKAELLPQNQSFKSQVAQVVAAVDQAKPINLSLDVHGTAFQQKVWQALQEIPLGQTASYSDIAQAIGKPKAVRAVATACAKNDVGVVIPCHRVVRSDKTLGGYRWGEDRKRKLLEKEEECR